MTEPEKRSLATNDDPAPAAKEIRKAVANIEFEAALGNNRPNPWGRGHLVLYCYCFLVYFCSTMNGYDGSLMGSINALEEYKSFFRLDMPSLGTGLVFSIWQIAQMAGACFLWFADWKGRKAAMFYGCLMSCVGVVLQATATDMKTFIGARFLLSFGTTIACTGAPIYLLEMAPPLYRATVAGMYNTLYYLGSIISAFACYGTRIHFADRDLAWRLPIWLQLMCPGIVVCGVHFLPESPRWLVAQDRYDEAKAIVIRHHANGDPDHPVVELEMREMAQALQESGGMMTPKSCFDFGVLFKTRNARYRLFLVIAMSWFGQFSGNNVASYYLPQMAKNVGVAKTETLLLLNGIYSITSWIAAIAGARLHDVFGRRIMLLWSTIGMSVSLAIMAGCAGGYEATKGVPVSTASIAWIYIFGMTFAVGYTPMQPIYPAEVLSNHTRAKGMMFKWFAAGAAGFANTFVAPLAMREIRYWFYVFFVGWDLFEAVIIYFFFVETKGRTIEELDEVFNAPNPRKASTVIRHVRETIYRDADGRVKVGVVEEKDSASTSARSVV